MHFASRNAMNIEGLGTKVAQALVDKEMVQTPADLYYLKIEDFMKLPGFAYKKAKNLRDGIEKSKKTTLGRFLFALGIRHVGEAMAQLLAERFKSLDKLIQASMADLTAIPGLGQKLLNQLLNFLEMRKIRG